MDNLESGLFLERFCRFAQPNRELVSAILPANSLTRRVFLLSIASPILLSNLSCFATLMVKHSPGAQL